MAHWEMQGWMILVLGWVFVPFYAHSKVFTMPEFLLKRYNKNTSSTLSIITLISYVLTKVSVTAFTGGIFLWARHWVFIASRLRRTLVLSVFVLGFYLSVDRRFSLKSSTIEPQSPCHPQSLERRLCGGEKIYTD